MLSTEFSSFWISPFGPTTLFYNKCSISKTHFNISSRNESRNNENKAENNNAEIGILRSIKELILRDRQTNKRIRDQCEQMDKGNKKELE